MEFNGVKSSRSFRNVIRPASEAGVEGFKIPKDSAHGAPRARGQSASPLQVCVVVRGLTGGGGASRRGRGQLSEDTI